MARTRKTVLGDNPFSSGQDATSDVALPESKAHSKGKVRPVAAIKPKKVTKEVEPRKATKSKPAKVGKTKPAKVGKTKPAKVGKTKPAGVAGSAVDRPVTSVSLPFGRTLVDDSAHATRQDQHASSKADVVRAEEPSREGGVFDAARDLLSSDYYVRQWGRIGMRTRSEEVDDFGHDRKYDARFSPLLDLLYDRYFRVDVEGAHHVPEKGRALIVANHGGTFPYDGVMLKTVLRRENPTSREVRWLAEDHLFYMPFLGSFLSRMGAVRACQENAERLLRQERLVAVFPEGAKGTGRLYKNRYKLQRFGRGGFVRLCLRTRTPIIPCIIVGAEESMPLLFRIEALADLLGVPYIPITPTFPLLGPLGVVPAPTKWQFTFGEPIRFDRHGVEAADDNVLVGRLTERVRATMQGMLDQAFASRRSVWFG